MKDLLSTGDAAPQFRAVTADEDTFDLADARGKWLVLYFYPRAHTSGCTREGQAFQALLAEFEASNALVAGISTDKPTTLARFRDKHGFGFPLVSDAETSISAAYGTLKDHGKSSNRVTYLIDPGGAVAAVWSQVKVDGHAEEVLARLRELGGAAIQ